MTLGGEGQKQEADLCSSGCSNIGIVRPEGDLQGCDCRLNILQRLCESGAAKAQHALSECHIADIS